LLRSCGKFDFFLFIPRSVLLIHFPNCFSELFNQKEIISKKHLKFAQNLWKLWIHLILTSLRPFHQPSSSSPLPTAQAPATAATAVLYTTPTKKNDPVSYANFSQQYEQIKRQQLKLKELLEKLADEEKKLQKLINSNNNNINGGNGNNHVSNMISNKDNNNNHIHPNQTMQIICKLILNEIISPVNGIGKYYSILSLLIYWFFQVFWCLVYLHWSRFPRN
jgi:hypothetical protein